MIGFGAGYLLTGKISSAIVAGVASILPDVFEKISDLIGLTKDGEAAHNPLYCGIAVPIVTVMAYLSGRVDLVGCSIVFSLGLVTHLVGDALTVTGIPIQ